MLRNHPPASEPDCPPRRTFRHPSRQRRAAATGTRPVPFVPVAERMALPAARKSTPHSGAPPPPLLPLLDALVNILDAPAGASAKRPGNRCLARSHEADKIQLVGLH